MNYVVYDDYVLTCRLMKPRFIRPGAVDDYLFIRLLHPTGTCYHEALLPQSNGYLRTGVAKH